MTKNVAAQAPVFLTKSQKAALVRLRKIMQFRGSNQVAVGGIRPRFSPLIVGASGCGKTAIVRLLSIEFGLSLLAISVPNWVVIGARSEPHTLVQIRDFVRSSPGESLIFFDELDKEKDGFADAWSASLGAELLMILDADARLAIYDWSEEDISRLAQCLVVGAGAWQRVAQRLRQPTVMGFGMKKSQESYAEMVAQDLGIAEELAFRFSPALISLLPPDREDMECGVRMIHDELGLPVQEQLLVGLLDRAEESPLGMRFLEGYLADLLMENPDILKGRETQRTRRKSGVDRGGSQSAEGKNSESDFHHDRLLLTQEAWKDVLKNYERDLVGIVEELEVWRVKCVVMIPSDAEMSQADRGYFDLLGTAVSDMGRLAGFWRAFCAAGKREYRRASEAEAATASRDLQKKLFDLLSLYPQRVFEDGIGEGISRLRARILWAIQQYTHLAITGKW